MDELILVDIWNGLATEERDIEDLQTSPSCPKPVEDYSELRDVLEVMIAEDRENGYGDLSRMLSKPSN